MKRSLTIGTVAAAASLALAAPAGAAPQIIIDHWTEHLAYLADEDPEFCQDLGFPVWFELDASGTFRGTVRNGVFYGASTVHESGSYTNLENGKTYSFRTYGNDMDTDVTGLGDGLVEIDVHHTGVASLWSVDGKPVLTDAGRVTFTLVIDTKGTPDPEDDEEIGFEFHRFTGGSQTEGRDFCADLVEFIG
ncbi:hypothetical protein [Isoptericola variabilis]|uniref:Htaa domain-containing protein n=1 Tax=Isoptericola variabilis (strain 225) TaxID=743718 RepID=F6FPG2_ISOV2|nr:hypothetical protein [Isoptericola variabilis]AEG43675.1 hypothetical protein Isova_0891 [Isoptericola variabilis 225]TWH27356.1 hypothetical protein L600_000500000290 [Isoptericola variabilis J7]